MRVTFRSAELARVCNSQEQLTRRWGDQAGRVIARRLCDLAAVAPSALNRLPESRVELDADGQVQLSFGRSVIIRGLMTRIGTPSDRSADGEGILITSVNVKGTEVR